MTRENISRVPPAVELKNKIFVGNNYVIHLCALCIGIYLPAYIPMHHKYVVRRDCMYDNFEAVGMISISGVFREICLH